MKYLFIGGPADGKRAETDGYTDVRVEGAHYELAWLDTAIPGAASANLPIYICKDLTLEDALRKLVDSYRGSNAAAEPVHASLAEAIRMFGVLGATAGEGTGASGSKKPTEPPNYGVPAAMSALEEYLYPDGSKIYHSSKHKAWTGDEKDGRPIWCQETGHQATFVSPRQVAHALWQKGQGPASLPVEYDDQPHTKFMRKNALDDQFERAKASTDRLKQTLDRPLLIRETDPSSNPVPVAEYVEKAVSGDWADDPTAYKAALTASVCAQLIEVLAKRGMLSAKDIARIVSSREDSAEFIR